MDIQTYSEKLIESARECKELAKEYMQARSKYAQAYNRISVLIYKSGLSEDKSAFEKIVPKLFNFPAYREEAMKLAEEMITNRQIYKGLEQVIKAYQMEMSGIQSVIKWHLSGEIAEATRQKYGLQGG